MILVAGGTGRLGRELVASLRAGGLPVRVLTRDAARAHDLRRLGAEVAVGDVRTPETLRTAVAGVATVVSAIHGFAVGDGGSPARVDRDGNAALLDAAAEAGAGFVLLSVLGAALALAMDIMPMTYEALHREDALRWRGTRTIADISVPAAASV